MSLLWSREVHLLVTTVHVFAGVFWLGWMVFMFGILRPAAARAAPDRAAALQSQAQRRVRRAVAWIVPILILTGLHNMGYHGLLGRASLLETAVGRRMLWKLGAATVLFGIYYSAPFVLRSLGMAADGGAAGSMDPADCHGNPDPLVRKASVVLHVVAFASGVTAAWLGVGIGG